MFYSLRYPLSYSIIYIFCPHAEEKLLSKFPTILGFKNKRKNRQAMSSAAVAANDNDVNTSGKRQQGEKPVLNSQYHQCSCYGHDDTLPDYKHTVSHPKTLQGYYANAGGCPCPAHANSKLNSALHCTCKGKGEGSAKPQDTYKSRDGPHTVFPATQAATNATDNNAASSGSKRRTVFPNSRNYGGAPQQYSKTINDATAPNAYGYTVAGGAASTQARRRQQRAERQEEQGRDRKNYLKAMLRDEMLARMDAESMRAEFEQELGIMGGNHAEDYRQEQEAGGAGAASGKKRDMHTRGINEVPTVPEQYEEIMDELRYVAGQPVGSKYNIIRLHYLIDEEERINKLRLAGKAGGGAVDNRSTANGNDKYDTNVLTL